MKLYILLYLLSLFVHSLDTVEIKTDHLESFDQSALQSQKNSGFQNKGKQTAKSLNEEYLFHGKKKHSKKIDTHPLLQQFESFRKQLDSQRNYEFFSAKQQGLEKKIIQDEKLSKEDFEVYYQQKPEYPEKNKLKDQSLQKKEIDRKIGKNRRQNKQASKVERFLTEANFDKISIFASMLEQIRSYDGSGNNKKKQNFYWGASNSPLERKHSPAYRDGIKQIDRTLRNARLVSNGIGKPNKIKLEEHVNAFFPYFTEFISHDIAFIPSQESKSQFSESNSIRIPKCDKNFDPNCTGKQIIYCTRSEYSWIYNQNIFYRNQINRVSAWIDASHLYGSTKEQNTMIRTGKEGKIKTEPIIAQLNRRILKQDQRISTKDSIVPAIYEIFAQYHNKLCDQVKEEAKEVFIDEEVFQIVRKYIIGILQKIIYEDFLPILMGKEEYLREIGKYEEYNPNLNPNLFNQFTNAAFLFWPSMLRNTFDPAKNLSRIETFQFLSQDKSSKRDHKFSQHIRNNYQLAQFPSQNLDFFSFILQKTRDHGLPNYNVIRQAYNLKPIYTFSKYTSDREYAVELVKNYLHMDHLQLWVGLIGEEKVGKGLLGELGIKIVGQGFTQIRNADRFWYEKSLPPQIILEIKNISLTDIIGIKKEKDNVFHV